MALTPETIWHLNGKDLKVLLNTGSLAPKTKVIHFYVPSFNYHKARHHRSSPSFPTISVTGTACALNCKHCGTKILKTMHPVNSPEKLFDFAVKLKQQGTPGCLISGGCRPEGSVPLQKFTSTIKKIKRKLGLTIFVHTGIINAANAAELKNAGVDAALIDIVGSDETAKKICNLNLTVKDYSASLKALQQAGLNFAPHVIVGLHDGNLKGEFKALSMIASVEPSAVVVIAFSPIHGTTMAEVEPPTPAEIAKVIAAARLMFPRTPMVLGCMRPKGRHRAETDVLAIQAGVDAIAFPSEEAVEYAERERYVATYSSYCCAQIYREATVRRSSE